MPELTAIERRTKRTVERVSAGKYLEGLANLLGIRSLARHAGAKLRLVEAALTGRLDERFDTRLLERKALRQPVAKDRFDAEGQSQQHIAGRLRAGFPNCLEDGGQFFVGPAGDDWGHKHADRHAGRRKFGDRIES